MRHEKSLRSLCQLNGYLIIIILHKRILIKLCQICLSSAVSNVVQVNFMLTMNIKFCIANFSTGMPFKIHFLIKMYVFFF